MRDAYPALIAAAPDAWKHAPVILEPCGTLSTWVSSNYPWKQALQWAVDNHASAFNTKSGVIPSVMYPAVEEMTAKLGYRLVLTQAHFPTSLHSGDNFRLTLNWANKGNAPMYFERRVLIKIGSQTSGTQISMKGFLPGTRTDMATIGTRGLRPGTHLVQIGLAPPGSENPDVALAIRGTGPWYPLGTIQITD